MTAIKPETPPAVSPDQPTGPYALPAAGAGDEIVQGQPPTLLERLEHACREAQEIADALDRRYARAGRPPCVCGGDRDDPCVKCLTALARREWADANLAVARELAGLAVGDATTAEQIEAMVAGVVPEPYWVRMWGDE